MNRGLGFGVSDSLKKGLLSAIVVLWDEKSCLGVCKSKENLEVAGGVSSIIASLAGISAGLGSTDFGAKD